MSKKEFLGIDLTYDDTSDNYIICSCSMIENNFIKDITGLCYTKIKPDERSIVNIIETYMKSWNNVIIEERILSREIINYLYKKAKQNNCRLWTVDCIKQNVKHDMTRSLIERKIINFPLEQPLEINVRYNGKIEIKKDAYNPLQNALIQSSALASYGLDLLSDELRTYSIKGVKWY